MTATVGAWRTAAWLLLWLPICLRAADFGDAPDARYVTPGSPCDGYPSTLASDGARHADTSRLWLGNSVTDEPDSKQAGDEDDFLIHPQVTSGSWRGDAWINVLVDNDPDDNFPCTRPYGRWESDADWTVRNLKVPDLKPGEVRPVSVPLPAGRCFRITLTTRPLSNYHGRGSFAYGETEDWCPAPISKTTPEKKKPPLPPPTTGEPPPPGGEPGPTGEPPTPGGPGPQPPSGRPKPGTETPHPFPVTTGSCKGDVELVCSAPRPNHQTRCEECIHRHLNACLFEQCMESDGQRYIAACQAQHDARDEANRIFACLSDPARGCGGIGKGGGKPSRSALVSQWKAAAKRYREKQREAERLKKALHKRRDAAMQQCRVQAEQACSGQCKSDDDRYRTKDDDLVLRQCNGQEPHCQATMDLWPPPRIRPFASHWLRSWKDSGRVYALALRKALAGYLGQQLHPYMIITRHGPPQKKARVVIDTRQEPPKYGKPRIFRTSCSTTEVTPVYLTTWEKAEYWAEYDFDLRVPLPLDIERTTLFGMLELLKKIPGLDMAIDAFEGFWDGYEERSLEAGDATTGALLGSLRETLQEQIRNYVKGKIEGKIGDFKAKGLEKLEQAKQKLADQLKNEFLTPEGRKRLEQAQEIVNRAREQYEKTMEAIDKAKELGQLPEKLQQELQARKKEAEEKLGACGRKLQAKIAARVKGDVESALNRLVGKRGSIRLSGGQVVGSGLTEGCYYQTHVHARLLTRICEEPSCDIDWRKKVLRDDCGETGGPGEPIVTLIRPPDNLSGFNPLDERDIREQIGSEEGGGTTPVVTGGGVPSGGGGGGGIPPCDAGPVAFGSSGFNIYVNFSYIETTGQCEMQQGLNQSPPFLAHGAYLFLVNRCSFDSGSGFWVADTGGTHACLSMGNSFWEMVSAAPASSVTPGQFGGAVGLPFNTDITLVLRCTGAGCPSGNPSFTGTLFATTTNARVQGFRPQ